MNLQNSILYKQLNFLAEIWRAADVAEWPYLSKYTAIFYQQKWFDLIFYFMVHAYEINWINEGIHITFYIVCRFIYAYKEY